MIMVQMTTSWDGIFLNILETSSMLPHFAYISTKLLHIKTFESHPHSMICLWTHMPSSNATMLAHAFNTPTKVIDSSHTPFCCICHNIVPMFFAFTHISLVPNIMVITTLALALGFATKAKAWKGVVRECNPGITFAFLGVWGNEPTYSQMDSHFENPYGASNFQKGISKVKTHCIKKLFISLERS